MCDFFEKKLGNSRGLERAIYQNSSLFVLFHIMELIKTLISQNKVMVFSKSVCPYCTKAKSAFEKLGVKPFVLEIDGRDDCEELQQAFITLTGKRSVPRVFINGVFLGGGDDTAAALANGTLEQKCREAGALA